MPQKTSKRPPIIRPPDRCLAIDALKDASKCNPLPPKRPPSAPPPRQTRPRVFINRRHYFPLKVPAWANITRKGRGIPFLARSNLISSVITLFRLVSGVEKELRLTPSQSEDCVITIQIWFDSTRSKVNFLCCRHEKKTFISRNKTLKLCIYICIYIYIYYVCVFIYIYVYTYTYICVYILIN